jgi:hypothetical protein
MLALTLMIGVANAYDAPAGGWAYTYDGASAYYEDVENPPASGLYDTKALDQTWDHKHASNNSDAWDGSAPGTVAGPPGAAPGGAGVFTEGADTFLRIQDPGNPTNNGWPDPSNRKETFAHDLAQDGVNGATILDDGVTLNFRIRIPTAATGSPLDNITVGGASNPWPAAGVGYAIHSDGMGPIGIKQNTGGEGMISFGLTHGDGGGDQATTSQPGLVMNQTSLTDTGPSDNHPETGNSGGTENLLPIADVTAWHEFWVHIVGDGNPTDLGTHNVTIWMDGNVDPLNPDGTFHVSAGVKDEYDYNGYLNMAHGVTGSWGSTDVDFYSYKPGLHEVPEPMTLTLLGLGGLGLIRRRRK